MTEPPTTKSFWVTDWLLAGKYPGAQLDEPSQLPALLNAGVRTFIDLTEQVELVPNRFAVLRPYEDQLPSDVEYVRIPVVDVTSPSREQVRSAIDAIRCGQDRGVVYLHCRGGCGRTGVVVGCYLVDQGDSADRALKRVQELTSSIRPNPCPETGEQIRMVRTWAAR
jgi:atypical dual specificity phosphatase